MQIGVISFQNSSFSSMQLVLLAEVIQRLTDENEQMIGLSTCHRHEIYFSAEDLSRKKNELIFEISLELNIQSLSYKFYAKIECFEHLAKLMAGLKSPILGESHVLNQVKKAYLTAQTKKKLNCDLHFLFQKSLKLAKEFRFCHEAILGKESLERLVIEKVRKKIQTDDAILLVGNSDLNRTILNELVGSGFKKIYLATKTEYTILDKKLVGMISYEGLQNWGDFQAVILATQAKYPLIEKPKGSVQTKLLIDLSIPRLVDPKAHFEGVEFFDLEMMNTIIQSKQIHLEDWKIDQERKLFAQVERQMILFYLKQLKKRQLQVR